MTDDDARARSGGRGRRAGRTGGSGTGRDLRDASDRGTAAATIRLSHRDRGLGVWYPAGVGQLDVPPSVQRRQMQVSDAVTGGVELR